MNAPSSRVRLSVEGGVARVLQVFYSEDCGHQAQTDRPDLVNPVLLEFFRDGIVGAPTAAGVSDRRDPLPDRVAQA
jgi:2-hydroxy-6-oxonona-2,4-dienedioate hydrolase